MALTEQLIDDLEAWAQRPDGQSLEQFLTHRVGEAQAAELLTAIDRGQRLFEALRTAREQEGLSREAWLARSLKPHLVQDATTGDFSLPLGEGRVVTGDSPQQVAATLVKETAGALWGRADAPGADASAWIDGAREHAAQMPDGAKGVLLDFFNTPVGAPVEREVAGVVAGSILHDQAQRPDASPVDAEAVGSAVDGRLFGAKVAAQLGQGKLTEASAQELLEDRIAAHLAGFAGKAVRQGLSALGAFVGGLIATRLGQDATLGARVGQWIADVAGETVAPFVEKGVQHLAKAGVGWGLRALGDTARRFAGKVLDFVEG